MTTIQTAPVALPRVAITYCTQCRWMLRAAYFGQELLSTFGTQIGEIALIPATGGLFTVELVRDCIDPSRDLGHSDKHGKKKEEKSVKGDKTEAEEKGAGQEKSQEVEVKRNPDGTVCEDCR
ncbi:hypothetical protein GGP41_010405 [Bipolaris sorokiniana]|uniref:Selenoprotein W-like protein n=1 Tax=Cochliobolus sativus TaxID=45130 RepID=A0A8H6DWT6_COCSA|nr:hypothetical protein GGP41_010405 [Bipolaris sorokiniana]